MKQFETRKPCPASPFPEVFLRILKDYRITPEEVAVFDIETTGLTPKMAMSYLIGVARLKGDTLFITQYLAESHADEADVLRAFADALTDCKLLLHFNGDQFDLPFVASRGALHQIETHRRISQDPETADILSYDLLKKVRPYKKALGLPDCRLKSVERLLGIARQDEMSGGELISVYEDYALHPTKEAEELLLLHNADDIAGTFSLLKVLEFPAFYNDLEPARFTHAEVRTESYTSFDGATAKECFVSLTPASPLPVSFACRNGEMHLRYENGVFLFRVPVVTKELKHFFPDYKNYYYLPYEEKAVHKSVGEFVDKNFRRKATREEACAQKTGEYLPCFHDIGLPVFKEQFKDKLFYIENSEDLRSSESHCIAYGISLLRHFAGFS